MIAVAVAVLIGFLLWSYRATSASFFRGTLAGIGLVLSFDIVWVHWIFGLHHLTNTQMDIVLEPLRSFRCGLHREMRVRRGLFVTATLIARLSGANS